MFGMDGLADRAATIGLLVGVLRTPRNAACSCAKDTDAGCSTMNDWIAGVA